VWLMLRSRHLTYVVQPGDYLYSIAIMFNTSVENIMALNGLVSPALYVGQTLLIPAPTVEARQKEYKPVTAYTATRPILVNRVDINTGQYPVLNFKPEGATYPYIYVPIAEFRRVGADVVWDPVNQVINVTSDYNELKNQVEALNEENQYLKSLLQGSPTDRFGNTIGNIINSGVVGKENDWLYYQKRQGNALYGDLPKIKTDLTMDTIVASDDDPLYINVLNGWVYYRNGSESGKIYKIKVDGTERTKLTDDSSTGLLVVGDWLYYNNQTERGKIYKIKVDGTERTKLVDDQASAINVIGDWIYYQNVTDNNKPYRVKVDGTGNEKLNDTTAYNLMVVDSTIYFINPEDERRIYKMALDGTNKTKLSDVPSSKFNIASGWIYYATVDIPGGDLYKMRLDGTANTFLNESYVTNIIVFDDWIYFTTIEKMVFQIKTDGTEKETLY
jgi:hypothetical protein